MERSLQVVGNNFICPSNSCLTRKGCGLQDKILLQLMNKKYTDNLNILDFPIISHQILLYYLKLYCYLKQYLILEFLFNCKSGFSCKFFSKSITLFVCTLYNHYLIEFVLKSCCSVKLVGEGFAHIFM